ncbi:MAM and LDL-receptor class A domain-containing protein 1-like [Glandiceps talaboti]
MEDEDIGTLNIYYWTETYGEKTLMRTIKADYGDVWVKDEIQFQVGKPFQVVIEGVEGVNLGADLSVDDVSFSPGCVLINDPLPPTVSPTPGRNTELECDFEAGDTCNWYQDPGGIGLEQLWDVEQGKTGLTSRSGPPTDHTTQTSDGWYAAVHLTTQLVNAKTTLISTEQSQTLCLSFWYHMSGSLVGVLEVIKDTGGILPGGDTLWTRTGDQGHNWIYAQVLVEHSGIQSYQLLIETTAFANNIGYIAIDDIVAYYEECPPLEECGFEETDWCGFENDPILNLEWDRIQAVAHAGGPGQDQTLQTDQGHYMYIDALGQPQGEVARLLSPMYKGSQEKCVKFWYHISGGDGAILNVYNLASGQQTPGDLVYQTSHSQSRFWNIGAADFNAATDFQIVYEGVIGQQGVYDISIDDVKVEDHPCTGLRATCDFEFDMCTWTNVKDDEFDWLRFSGSSALLFGISGPTFDHTTGTPDGWYILFESEFRSRDEKARVVSDVFSEIKPRCFEFYYHMYGPNVAPGDLAVYVEHADSLYETRVWFQTGDKGDRWHEAHVDIDFNAPYRIVIEGKIDTSFGGDIAVDDTRMYDTPCSELPTPEPFVCEDGQGSVDDSVRCDWKDDCADGSDERQCGECNFEEDQCLYRDVSRGEYQWDRLQGSTATPETGPSIDCDVGTKDGHYMAVEASDGNILSYAVLDGPKVKECSTTCEVQFCYHMYGDETGRLEVYYIENNLETRILALNGDQGDIWRDGIVIVGRVATDWQLAFRGKRLLGEKGDIAIDDIHLINCDFPEIEADCGVRYQCDRGSCVEEEQLCDFTDDCGDFSDELHETCNDYTQCNFEYGFCDWTNDYDDSFDWEREKGETGLFTLTGPSRDHTRNNAAGTYIYIDTRPPQRSGDNARLISHNFEGTDGSGSCVMRFYYHMYGSNIGSLKIYTRTAVGGPLTELWSHHTQVGDFFVKVMLEITETDNFQVIIEGIVGFSIGGDIAVDDVTFTPECIPFDGSLPEVTPSPTPPSPCPGQFVCEDGVTCLPLVQVCDFKEQCPSGSDELVCGTCDFEIDTCGWEDTSAGMYTWERFQAGTSTSLQAPDKDAAGRDDGHYMLVEGSGSRFYLGAFLETMVHDNIGQCCVMQLYYHMSGNYSGSLFVYLQDPDDNLALYILYQRLDDQGIEWHRADIYTGSHGRRWRFDIESYPLLGTIGGNTNDVAVDEIKFIDCHPDDVKDTVAGT